MVDTAEHGAAEQGAADNSDHPKREVVAEHKPGCGAASVDVNPAQIGGERAVARCDQLGREPFSDTPDGLFRGYLTPAHGHAVGQIAQWMCAAGMTVRIDVMGTLIGRYEGHCPDAPAFIIGSHIDSVRDAGRYDGPLGVMLGIECVAAFHAAGRRFPFAIEVMGFGDEEGSRFPASMLCSQAIAGTLDPLDLQLRDRDGISVKQALKTFEQRLTVPMHTGPHTDAAYDSASVLGYLEAHIEQGPVLEAEGLAVAAVSGIAAQKRFAVSISGQAGHAGTSAMHLRKDALAAAAEIMLAIEAIARNGDQDDALVATVGQLAVAPGATNVVPGRVSLSLDVRAKTDAARDAAAERVAKAIGEIEHRRGVRAHMELVQALSAAPSDSGLTRLLESAMTHAQQPQRTLVSGAGHDAMVMADLCPTTMLFIRCGGGISHNPRESVCVEHVDAAYTVMMAFFDRLEAESQT